MNTTIDLPRTLLDIAGAARPPAGLGHASLVLIDHQREYRDGKLPLAGIDAAIAACADLLAAVRKSGMPVIHVVQHGRPGGALFDPEGPMSAIFPELAPRDGEEVIVKSLPNAFAGTTLADALRRNGYDDVIFGGFMTHVCISASVRASLDIGFKATLVGAATATRDLPGRAGQNGTIVAAANIQSATLAALGDRFAVIVDDAAALS